MKFKNAEIRIINRDLSREITQRLGDRDLTCYLGDRIELSSEALMYYINSPMFGEGWPKPRVFEFAPARFATAIEMNSYTLWGDWVAMFLFAIRNDDPKFMEYNSIDFTPKTR